MSDATADSSTEVIVGPSLAAELERSGVHGVHAGDRVRLQLIHGEVEEDSWTSYVGSFDSGDPSLAARAKEIARSELGSS